MKNIKRFLAAMMVIAAVLITPLTAHAQDAPAALLDTYATAYVGATPVAVPAGIYIYTGYQATPDGNKLWAPVNAMYYIPEEYMALNLSNININYTADHVVQGFKTMFPNGYKWDMNDYYTTISDVTGQELWTPKTVQACEAFSYMLSDAIFGSTKMNYYNYYNGLASGNFQLCLYDILVFDTAVGTRHAAIVIDIDSKGTVYVAEGNYGGVVNWGRAIKLDGSDGNHLGLVIRREGVMP